MFRLVVVVGLAGYVAAQSSQCISALTNIAANAAASQCLAVSALIPVVTASKNTSLVQPFNNWLSSMCGAPACSNATIAAVVTNLTSGCSTELNVSSDPAPLIPTVQSLYPTVRKILCLKHGDTLCITETLTNVETITGPLTLTNVLKIAENPPTTIPSNITCTDCNKASYNIWVNDVPSSASTAKPVLESQCNASFVDGSSPPGISQSASTGVSTLSTSATNSAFSLLGALTNSVPVAVGASGLIALSTVFSILI